MRFQIYSTFPQYNKTIGHLRTLPSPTSISSSIESSEITETPMAISTSLRYVSMVPLLLSVSSPSVSSSPVPPPHVSSSCVLSSHMLLSPHVSSSPHVLSSTMPLSPIPLSPLPLS